MYFGTERQFGGFMEMCFKQFLQSSLLLTNTNVTRTTAFTVLLELYDLDEDNFILLTMWSTLQVDIKINYHIVK